MPRFSSPAVFADDPATGAAREPGLIRQLVEAAILLALAVILFRGFVAEGYMISTGSMAPCLLGYHRQIVCPDCAFAFSRGTRYDIDESILAQGGGETDDFGLIANEATICPNCGFDHIDVHQVPRNEGDQLLVQKNFFQLRHPRRWEVVVFRHPADAEQAYVKRVIGLPSEDVQLIDGDVFINDRLQRKSPAVQRSMRIGVYDNDYAPLDKDWNPRWQSRLENGWSPDGNAFEYHTTPAPSEAEGDVHWLTYRHWVRSGGQHQTSVPLPRWPDDAPALGTLTSASISPNVHYDLTRRQLVCQGVLEDHAAARLRAMSHEPEFQRIVDDLIERSHIGQITDVYGYNHPQAGGTPFPTHDLMVEATVAHRGGTGKFHIRMHDGWHWFDAIFDFESRMISLLSDESPQPLAQSVLPPRMLESPTQIEMSLFDRQVLLAVDGEVPFPPVRYAAEQRPRELPPEPVRLGAAGANLRVEHLRLHRDVYYTPKHAGAFSGHFSVGAEELFVLGDNSPVSVDSRLWDSSTIPQRLLIGKPFVVHLPSRQERVEIGSSIHHIRIPDFSRVRYIQ